MLFFLPYRNSEIVIVGGINYPGSAFVLNVQTGINIKKSKTQISNLSFPQFKHYVACLQLKTGKMGINKKQ
jgi:hypothetical protein